MYPDNTPLPEAGDATPPEKKLVGTVGAIFLALFGIVLPLATLVIELATGFCSEILFDPIPTQFHTILVALVPVANAALLMALLRPARTGLIALSWLNGIALGIAAYYALVFLPVSPFALIGVIVYGIGLLPLSPLTSFVCAIILRRKLRRMAAAIPLRLPRVWLALCIGLTALVLTEGPRSVSLIGLQMAASDAPGTRAKGIHMLRRYGSRDTLLRACYSRRGIANDPLSYVISELGESVTTHDARRIYYLVTGTPFNAVRPPRIRTRGGLMFGDFDFDVGGDQVQARVRGLSLGQSSVDATIDADAALAYTEWTLEFKNESGSQQEARGQITLPPGGVVSRLTLWINGEECEAAFGGRSQVREAYQKVVSRRRDPVLVTTSGPDRVLVQCFPVPPNGGTMKLRLGITSPLVLAALEQGHYRLPYFAERNFGVRADMESATWLEAKTRLSLPLGKTQDAGIKLRTEKPDTDTFALRGTTAATSIEMPVWVAADRDPTILSAWSDDTRDNAPAGVLQKIIPTAAARPDRVVFVVDGSRRMKRFRAEIVEALTAIPRGMKFAVLVAGDTPEVVFDTTEANDHSINSAANKLRAYDMAGGTDNASALSEAWDLAADKPNSVIVWLHATQPVSLGEVAALKQRWIRRPGNPRLIAMQFGGGPNVLMAQLDDLPEVDHPLLAGSGATRLRSLLSQWSGDEAQYKLERSRHASPEDWQQGKQTSGHLARLWAYDRIQYLLATADPGQRDEALTLATTYQLVTPVSGAVVLETQQQYKDAGLEPVAKSSVPTIPEPETWALMFIAALVLGWHAMTHRRRRPLRIRI